MENFGFQMVMWQHEKKATEVIGIKKTPRAMYVGQWHYLFSLMRTWFKFSFSIIITIELLLLLLLLLYNKIIILKIKMWENEKWWSIVCNYLSVIN